MGGSKLGVDRVLRSVLASVQLIEVLALVPGLVTEFDLSLLVGSGLLGIVDVKLTVLGAELDLLTILMRGLPVGSTDLALAPTLVARF